MKNYKARLLVKGMPTMSAKQIKELVAWLEQVAKDIKKEKDLKIYVKNPKFTLY